MSEDMGDWAMPLPGTSCVVKLPLRSPNEAEDNRLASVVLVLVLVLVGGTKGMQCKSYLIEDKFARTWTCSLRHGQTASNNGGRPASGIQRSHMLNSSGPT